MWLNNVIFEDRTIQNERLEFCDKASLYFLGHNLTLRDCTLVLGVPAARIHINKTHITGTTIEVKRTLTALQWDRAHLKQCHFKGRFHGNDFGSWRDAAEGSIKECDFTQAQLHECRFFRCDIRTLRLPPWPSFTLVEPVRRWRQLSSLPWPGGIGPIVVAGLAEEPPVTTAVTYSAIALARKYGTTPEAIRAVVEQLDGVSS